MQPRIRDAAAMFSVLAMALPACAATQEGGDALNQVPAVSAAPSTTAPRHVPPAPSTNDTAHPDHAATDCAGHAIQSE